jgi:hypothetical protein
MLTKKDKVWQLLVIGGQRDAAQLDVLLDWMIDTGDKNVAFMAAVGVCNAEMADFLMRRGWSVPGWAMVDGVAAETKEA